jgi:predicted TIM-barrel fold metal-dependent hydrolase
VTRREVLLALYAAGRPGALIDTHIHLFDPARFPYHPNAPYQPPPQTLGAYASFAKAAGIGHAILVHPEPYQDDHRYLEYCFAHEPSVGFFKGTCLFDPIAPGTPARMEALAARSPGRIVALRIHEMDQPGAPPASTGAIKNRDLRHPAMRATWAAAGRLGLAIQMHMLPHYAPPAGELAEAFPKVNVIIDHLGRAGEGTARDREELLKLARHPNVWMKFTTASRASLPYVRSILDAFGANRMIWGGLGMNLAAFGEQQRLFEDSFGFASAADREAIRSGNAAGLFKLG